MHPIRRAELTCIRLKAMAMIASPNTIYMLAMIRIKVSSSLTLPLAAPGTKSPKPMVEMVTKQK